MKKKIIFLFFMLVSCLCFAQIKTGSFSDLEISYKENPKPVIIHFYTDWCAICKIEAFQLNKNKELVKIINEDFYFINFEAEKTKEKITFKGQEFDYLPNGNAGIHALALAFLKDKNQPVYPLWIILDKNQNLIYYQEGLFEQDKMKQKLLEISAHGE